MLASNRDVRDQDTAVGHRLTSRRAPCTLPPSVALRPGRYCDSVSVAAYSVVAVAIMLASCMQGSIGFGMGMLAAPIVALVDPGLIPGTLIMLAAFLTIFVV